MKKITQPSSQNNNLQVLLVPISIVLAGVLIMVSVLITAKTLQKPNESLTKATIKEALTEVIREQSNGQTQQTPFDESKLVELAQQISLDKDKFVECQNSGKFNDEIQKDIADSTKAGAEGTPGFIIGTVDAQGMVKGALVPGAYPIETFRTVIDQIKAGKLDEVLSIKGTDGAYIFPKAEISIDDDAILGDSTKSNLAIVELSDYECPFCKKYFDEVYPLIKKEYIETNKAFVVFRDYIGIPSHNPAAIKEAHATECAQELGGDRKFYELHDLILSKTRTNGLGI